MVRHGAL